MVDKPSTQMSAEERFWAWFSENAEIYMNIKENQMPLIDRLREELSAVSEGLTFEISSKQSYGRDLIISGDGNQSLFSAVLRLVAAAPIISQWRIIPFRPPRGTDFTIDFGEEKLDLSDVWFSVTPNIRLLDITFFISTTKNISYEIR